MTHRQPTLASLIRRIRPLGYPTFRGHRQQRHQQRDLPQPREHLRPELIVTVSGAPDTTAPSVPGGLAATAAGSSQINLTWTASTDAVGVQGYKIFRNGSELVIAVECAPVRGRRTTRRSCSEACAIWAACAMRAVKPEGGRIRLDSSSAIGVASGVMCDIHL